MMDKLDDLIRYENENSGLDFKAKQYFKANYDALIKDLMSMANANIEGRRIIVIGVKHKPNGDRDFIGIPEDEFTDSAIYQQIIRENIEPEIEIDYQPYKFEGVLIGILKILKYNDKPYFLRKDYGNLKKGLCLIRKGSQQASITRRDLDNIYAHKTFENQSFEGKVLIGFSGTDFSKEIELSCLGEYKAPSDFAAEKIQKILSEKKQKLSESQMIYVLSTLEDIIGRLPMVSIPYEDRTIEELERDLHHVKETYQKDDLYNLFEVKSHKINLSILNKSEQYLEDASIRIEIDNIGILIPDKIYEKPTHNSYFYEKIQLNYIGIVHYPSIDYSDKSIVIYQSVGNLKHHISIDVFKQSLRLVIPNTLKGQVIKVKCMIFGKNLKNPLTDELYIKAI